ncbi:MAG TPA: hypothetical protein VGX25_10825 [Actinophytocola sp.]|uniref:hypothetical protein n=1 Tax=Actinophytocola sp. TaxID=1872138 RepID=UPI002DDCEA85|nr:hypothetical protein [Actinophytocola sp.]HEV2779880.1 hypothetical protein [Actinophytocola sp.]
MVIDPTVPREPSMNHKKIVLSVATALALAGCGSTMAGQSAGPPAASSSAPTTDPPATSSSTPPAAAGDDAGTTPTGTTLKVGQPATVLYETKDGAKETTRLEVTATSVEKGAISDLKNFDLDAQTKLSEPFYVHMTFRNTGPNPMEPGGIFGLVEAHNTDGDELNRLSLIGEFDKCDGEVVETLAVGQSYTDCGVYLAPSGQALGDVTFGFYLGSDRTEIIWKP